MLKYAQQLEEHEKEKQLLLVKLKGLEEKVEELQVDLRERSGEVAKRKESYEKLLQCNELKALELVSEKNEKRDIIASYERQLSRLVTGKNEKRDLLVSYKRLKSENNYLRKKLGLTLEDKIPQNEVEEETNSLRHHWNQPTSSDAKNNNPDTSVESRDINKLKNEIIFQEKLDDEKGVELIRTSTSRSPSFSSPGTSKFTSESKSAPLAGMKRPASHWRDTRSRQCQDGPDPHDDFLDTPLENIRGNLSKAIKEEVHDLPVRVPQDMNFDSSDDETQDMNVAPSPQRQQMPIPKPNTRSYKYVEPVRKKAERENLVGIECKQCKKFYDAVLPDGGGKDTDGNNRNFRCEHHDGVSRHRYRYVPPSTPEGFWNIGFDSEM
ncbi:hypothetical protein L1049_012255 [Liquidambar formosana]|uniref:DNA endonuclease activator Ctp1 C-terminal domain-containing protein n=1 Tax=Liquidambar formosana TaxID=63359 RepID=A0AAP0RXU3_LIQFO